MEKLEFKLLTLITILADQHLAYRGTLTDMCHFFGIATRDSRTNQKLRVAIQSLETKGFIKTIMDGRTWTLSLAKKAERGHSVIRIKREWVLAAKTCQGNGVDWSAVLKVWLYLIDNTEETITSSDIANELNISISSVSRAKGVLMKQLNAVIFKPINKQTKSGEYHCLGSSVTLNAWIDE